MSKHGVVWDISVAVIAKIAVFVVMSVVISTVLMIAWNTVVPELTGLPLLSWYDAVALYAIMMIVGETLGFGNGAKNKK